MARSFADEVGKKGMVLRCGRVWFLRWAAERCRGAGHNQRWKPSRGRRWPQHDYMQGKESLDCKFTHVRAATQHVARPSPTYGIAEELEGDLVAK